MKRQFTLLVSVIFLTAAGCQKDHKNAKQPVSPVEGSEKAEVSKEAMASGQAAKQLPSKTAAPSKELKKQPSTAARPTPPPAAPAPRVKIEGAVATVNGVIIDSATFYEEVDRISRRNPRIPADRLARIENNILQRLIDRELVKQEIQKAGIKVTEQELATDFKEYRKRFQSDEQFQNYLKHGKVTEETIKKRLREKKSLKKLIEAKGNLEITPEEANAFYTKNIKFYTEEAKVKASHILLKLPPKATPEQEKAVLSRIKKIGRQVSKKGSDFAAIAKELSEGPSKTKGGDLGYFTFKQMLKPFSEKAFSMKPGQTSGPVKTRFGYHIIRVFDAKPERKKSFEEVREQISKSLENKKFFKERRRLLGDLKKEAKIVSNLPEPPPPTPRKSGGVKPSMVNPHAGIPGAPDLRRRPARPQEKGPAAKLPGKPAAGGIVRPPSSKKVLPVKAPAKRPASKNRPKATKRPTSK